MKHEKVFTIMNKELLSRVQVGKGVLRIDAMGMYYRDLNALLRELSNYGVAQIEIDNVYGQRYIETKKDWAG